MRLFLAKVLTMLKAFCILIGVLVCGILAFILKFQADEKTFRAKAILILNITRNTVLFESNGDKQLPFASIAKVITAILALEKAGDPETVYIEMERRCIEEISQDHPALTFVGNHIGERFSLLDYLYGTLLESGCEAAQQIAYYVGDGSMERFLELANRFVKTLGCEHTHLVDPSGLHDMEQYSTARDVSRILRYAMENPAFRRIVTSCRYKTEGGAAVVKTTNLLIDPESDNYFPYAVGGKTGTTDIAGRCLACCFERNGQEYLFVGLGYPSVSVMKNRQMFFQNFVAELICSAFEAEGDFMRVLLPQHLRTAEPGERFLLSPVVRRQNCDVEPQIRFSSGEERIASVTPDGYVTVHERGVTQIRAMTQTGDYDLCFVDSRNESNGTLCRERKF